MEVNPNNLYVIIQNKEGRYCRYVNGFDLPEGWFYPENDRIVIHGFPYAIYDNNGNLNPQFTTLERYSGT